jgi:hypothetical protein
MKPEEIELSDVKYIFELYEKYCGIGMVPINETDHYAKGVLQNLQKGFGGDYRFGSKWESIDSKMQFSIKNKNDIAVHFYHNLHDEFTKKRFQKDAEKGGKEFETLANNYLSNR